MKNLLSNKFVIAIICAIVVAIVGVLIVFNNKDDKTQDPTPQEETESQTVMEEIGKGGNSDILDITSLSKDEFVKLTWEQVRDFVENRLPNYRGIYGIPSDTVMEQDDWEKLKKIIFWQLFDQTYDSYINVGNVSKDVEIEKNEWGTDIIYAEPTEEYIDGLSTDEFREYTKGFMKFAEAGPEAILAIDLLTDEQIEEMRVEFKNEYFK